MEVSFGWNAGRQYLPLWVHITGYQARLARACAARRRCLYETAYRRDSWEDGTNPNSLPVIARRHGMTNT